MQAILKLQAATMAARNRTGDERISTSVEGGMFRVELVTPVKGRSPDVQELTGPLSLCDALCYLERMK